MNDEDEVGYKRPPRHTQFKKGQSGNPKGRPKGLRNPEKLFLDEANRLVTITEKGRSQKIPCLQAIFRQLFAKAALGNQRAAEFVTNYMSKLSGSSLADLENEIRKDAQTRELMKQFINRQRLEQDYENSKKFEEIKDWPINVIRPK